MTITLVALFILIFNIPFGYWRANTRKFSIQWMLAIHIPVPVNILLKKYTEIGFSWYTFIILLIAFFLGQFIGHRFSVSCRNKDTVKITSFMFIDVYRMMIEKVGRVNSEQ